MLKLILKKKKTNPDAFEVKLDKICRTLLVCFNVLWTGNMVKLHNAVKKSLRGVPQFLWSVLPCW